MTNLKIVFIIFCLVNLHCLPSSSSSPATNQTRIINGELSQLFNWPFIAAIYYNGGQICGGTIWNEDTVVTAAHCVFQDESYHYASNYKIILGHVDLSDWDRVDSNYVFGARRLARHSKYDATFFKYDIGIIKLDRPIDFTGVNKRVRCVCNPVPIEQVKASECITMGWGLTRAYDKESLSNKLLEINVPLLPDDYCEAQFPTKFNTHWSLCAGYQSGAKDSCTGDSGGPLVCPLLEDSSKWSLVGVISFGRSCATPNDPGYYTKVINFVHWINVKAGEV